MKYLIFIFILNFFGCSKQEKTSNHNADSVKNVSSNNIQTSQNIEIDTIVTQEIDDKKNQFAFGGFYPKITGLNDKDFESKINELFKNNYIKYFEESKKEGGVNASIGFEVLNVSNDIISVVQHTGWTVYDANGYGFDAYVVNADIKNNRFLTNADFNLNDIKVKDFNSIVLKYFKKENLYDPIEDFSYIPKANNFEDLNKYKYGIKDGYLVLVENAMPSARASMGVYIIPIKKFYGGENSEKLNANDNTNSSNSSEASETVKNWIIALGKQDFSTAYYTMSPKARGDYNKFKSIKAYGGITKTNIHSVDVTSSSGCYYEVVAVYDSYDPSNRDGKFTQKFEVSSCDGSWLITSVKNMKVEYFR